MRPAGFLDLREARRRAGQRVIPGWQKEGADEYAPSAGEDAAEMRAIAEMPTAELRQAARYWRQSIEQAAATERAARKAAGQPPSGVKEAAQKMREQIAATKDRATRARLKKLLASLEAPALAAAAAKPRAGQDTRAELDATRARLMDEATARHEQHQAARLRWAAADGIVRDKAGTGEWRVLAQLAPPFAEVICLTADQLIALWPKANETHITVPYDGISVRARLLIAEAEIDRDFPPKAPNTARSAAEGDETIAPNGPSAAPKNDAMTGKHKSSAAPKQPQRGIWQPSLKQYMQFNRGRLEKLNDDEIVGLFRRHMSEQHAKMPLERRRDRIMAKVESFRRDLSWVPASAGGEQSADGG